MAQNREFLAGGNSLPVIHVRGTNYQVGFEVGRLMREHIQSFYSIYTTMHQTFLPFIKTEKGQIIYEGYLNVVKENFPQYFEEIRGISEGSDVPFEQIFLMHIRSEVGLLIKQGQYETACSTVFVNCPDAQILAHNEDADPEMKTRSYMISAEILGEHGAIVEQYTGFAYPGTLPGHTFSFNHAGIVFSINSTVPVDVGINKIPLHISNRALLAAECQDDVEKIINKFPGLALGCSLNVVFIGQSPDGTKICNYELMGSLDPRINAVLDCATTSLFDVSKPAVEGNGFMYHFNKYERMKVEQHQTIKGSIHRQNRVKQFPMPQNVEDVRNVLGDTCDSEFPLYRTPSKTDGGCTIAVALFDLKNMTLAVYRNNPKTSSPTLVMPISKPSIRC